MADPLRPLLDAAPDAVVVVRPDGAIAHANGYACELFGYSADAMRSMTVEQLVPGPLRPQHEGHRARYLAAPVSRPMAAGRDLYARHADGHSIPVDIALAPVTIEGAPAVAAFVRDATPRRVLEQHRERIRAGEQAQAQALELNDSVVQGLTAIAWLLEVDAPVQALVAARETLASARGMMSALLGEAEGSFPPGELRRQEPAHHVGVEMAESEPTGRTTANGLRVLIADDSVDVRLLLRIRLETVDGLEVVGEAEDGQHAITLVEELTPDVLVLDLSMPVMDGFEVARHVRDHHPATRIIVLSGHPASQMRRQALASGADAYIEKGTDFDVLIDAITGASAVTS